MRNFQRINWDPQHPQNTVNIANPTLVHKIDQKVYQI
jgi:hypothetical protein